MEARRDPTPADSNMSPSEDEGADEDQPVLPMSRVMPREFVYQRKEQLRGDSDSSSDNEKGAAGQGMMGSHAPCIF